MSRPSATQLSDYVKTLLNIETIVYIEKPLLTEKASIIVGNGMMGMDKPSTVYWLDDRLYLNITNQCSNNCWFCFRNYKQGISEFNLKLTHEPEAAEVIAELEPVFLRRRWSEIVFCGFGEPTARLDVLIEVAKWIKGHFSSVSIRVDTNGHGCVLNKGRNVVLELKDAGVCKVCVSLNGYNDETYNENC
jgi:cyclic pyranopterin phosphate synthase